MRTFSTSIVISTLIVLALTAMSTRPAQAQTYTVLHTFTGGSDGANPLAGLTIDAAGNLYGTAESGGLGYGLVFKLRQSGSSWVLNPLYSFTGGSDGGFPTWAVTLAANGTLYGTTESEDGTVFHLAPSPTAPKTERAPWNENVLYRFTGGSDGADPSGDLVFDQSGSIYSAAFTGGVQNCHYSQFPGCGVVYKLTPSGGGWAQTVLYSFQGGSDAAYPTDGVAFDTAGNLYGTTAMGGLYNQGAAYQLSPSGSGWTEHVLYDFTGQSDGSNPVGLVIDSSGNLYGATAYGAGGGGGGTAFELTPSNGGWKFSTIYSFSCQCYNAGPAAKLIIDAAGNLYGTTFEGGDGFGSVFKLTPSGSGWTYTALHIFEPADGIWPESSLVFDTNGNLYGTTSQGGNLNQCQGNGCGTVFKINP